MFRLWLRLCLGLLALAPSGLFASEPAPDLTLYTYDSFVAKGGLGPAILPLFESRCGCKVKALSSGDGGQLLTRLQLDAERGHPGAQLVVGIDQPIFARARAYLDASIEEAALKGWSRILAEAKLGPGFVPYDYGAYALMADTQEIKNQKLAAPASVRDLLRPEYRRSILLEDPRTSAPGLAFLLYTQSLFRDGVWGFWHDLRAQWLTLAPGWDGAYGLFLKGEAPLVWSYVTSQAYHEEHGDQAGRYRAVLFQEGQPLEIEGAAVVKGALKTARQRTLARRFLEFLISPEAQARIPKANWMMPVLQGAELPPSFQRLPKPTRLVETASGEAEIQDALKKWGRVVQGAKP